MERRSLVRRPQVPEVTTDRIARDRDAEYRRLAALAQQNASEYDSFRTRIRIDKNHLDDAIQEQAQVYLEVCEHAALAGSARDLAKDELARKDAGLARDIRAKLLKAGGKTNDSIVNDEVMLHPDHQSASSAVDESKKVADKWGALVKAFEQRMRMLRELVSLYNSGYWNTSGANKAGRDRSDANVAAIRDARARGDGRS